MILSRAHERQCFKLRSCSGGSGLLGSLQLGNECHGGTEDGQKLPGEGKMIRARSPNRRSRPRKRESPNRSRLVLSPVRSAGCCRIPKTKNRGRALFAMTRPAIFPPASSTRRGRVKAGKWHRETRAAIFV